MPEDQKRALVEMLKSVQNFYTAAGQRSDRRGPRGITMPYTVREEAMTAGSNVAYNGYAHSFAGMGDSVPALRRRESRHRDPARTAARAVEAAAQRAGLAVHAARPAKP